jgi:uncharacterized protein
VSIAVGEAESANGRPVGSLIRCVSCGTHRLAGSTARCRTCHDVGGEPADASGPVTLYSFTEVHRSFPGIATPVILGWVDHPTGVRLLCRIDGADAATLVPGTALELVDQLDDAVAPADRIPYWCRPISALTVSASPGVT